jgi:hypothetical protein
MLNQNDRRRLEEIERRLQEEDPEFASRFTRWPQRTGTSRLLPILVIALGVLGMATSVVMGLPAVLVLSMAATVTGGIWLYRRRRL